MSKTLTAITAATLPLAGTEEVYVVQGGNSRKATAADVVAGSQPLNSNLTSWAAITRASGFDALVATPSSANLKALLTDETGSGANVFAGSPALTGTPTAPTASIGTATTQIATTEFVSAIVQEVPLLAANTAAANTTILQNAINAASNTTLYLPAGSFFINAVTLSPGVRLKGKGKEVTILAAGTNGIAMLNYTVATSTKIKFAVSDIGLTSASATGCTAISIDGTSSVLRASEITLKDLDIVGAGFNQGVYLRYGVNAEIADLFISLVVDGIVIDNCNNTNISGCKVQSGSGIGYKIIGGAGAFDEGIRMTTCSTDTHNQGIQIDGQEWGVVSSCSFTTCAGGPLIALNASSNWKFSACDFSTATGAPAQPNIVLSATSQNFSFVGCNILIGTKGATIRGTRHTIASNVFYANSDFDIYLDSATFCTVTGNVCASTTAAQSIVEAGTADSNVIVGNKTQSPHSIIGALTVAQQYNGGVTSIYGTAMRPSANDGASLGVATIAWADLFLASGGVLNWNNGNYTVTHTAGNLSFNGAVDFTGAVLPTVSGTPSLGSGTKMWANLFVASGGTLNFNNGNYTVTHSAGILTFSGAVLSTGTGGVGYATGAGGAVTQLTSRATGVTINKTSGAITMFSAAGSATAGSFQVTNSTVAATDTIVLNQKSGSNLYVLIVTTVAAGSFNITFFTTGGTAVDAPVINFNVIKGVAA